MLRFVSQHGRLAGARDALVEIFDILDVCEWQDAAQTGTTARALMLRMLRGKETIMACWVRPGKIGARKTASEMMNLRKLQRGSLRGLKTAAPLKQFAVRYTRSERHAPLRGLKTAAPLKHDEDSGDRLA